MITRGPVIWRLASNDPLVRLARVEQRELQELAAIERQLDDPFVVNHLADLEVSVLVSCIPP